MNVISKTLRPKTNSTPKKINPIDNSEELPHVGMTLNNKNYSFFSWYW